MARAEMWDSNRTGQFVLKGFEKLVGGRRWRKSGRFPELKIVEPPKVEDPKWLREHWELTLNPSPIPTFREKPAGITLDGRAIYLDRIREPERDIEFLERMEKVRIGGGGIVIYLDPGDPYWDTGEEDRGYHYATLGLDLTQGSGELQSELWEYFQYYGGITMPLPMFAERLGLVEIQDAEFLGQEEIEEESYLRRITISFPEIVGVLAKMFRGNVRFGIRSQKDKLFHFHRQELEPTLERVRALYEGPLLPTGEDDEEHMARFKEWLLSQDGKLINAAQFFRLFF